MRRRWIESTLAAISLAGFLLLGYWMLNSDQRLDQVRLGHLQVSGNAGKLLISWGNHSSQSSAALKPLKWLSFLSYASVPYETSANAADCSPEHWVSFTYLPSQSGAVRSIVIPAWLPLLLLVILPGLWIYGMPAQPRRKDQEQAQTSAA